jgi:hypothetical protein
MTLAEAEQRMQQQWHDLVQAEQSGASLELLEQMYDRYILLAEEFNAIKKAYARKASKAERAIKTASRKCA